MEMESVEIKNVPTAAEWDYLASWWMCGTGEIPGNGSASLNQYLTGHIQYTAATKLNMKNSAPYSGEN